MSAKRYHNGAWEPCAVKRYLGQSLPNPETPIVYGWHVDPSNDDPSTAVTYLADAVGKTPAAMGAQTFDYGSWANAFFMPRPCMLRYDGTVAYYLDPDDYSKKADGTPSDIDDYSFGGNAMMEWGLLWFKFVAGEAEGEGSFYVANKQIDDSYHAWCNYDADGNLSPHFYTAIYNGVSYDGKMRSLSGKKLSPWSTTAYSNSATYAVGAKVNYNNRMWECTTAVDTPEAFDPTKWQQYGYNGNTAGAQEVADATANNANGKPEWYIDVWADRILTYGLQVLLTKSLDLQGKYGRGIDSGGQAVVENYVTGAADDKGLFYGSTANGSTVVKVFGMENPWACKWRRTAGLIGAANDQYAYKLTWSQVDGTSITGYQLSATGYLTADNVSRPASSGSYVSKMAYGKHGLLPASVTDGASNKYYCDAYYNGTGFALVGGGAYNSLGCGFYLNLHNAFSIRYWNYAAALSCKPISHCGWRDCPEYVRRNGVWVAVT